MKLRKHWQISFAIQVTWASQPKIIDGVDYVCLFEIIDDGSNTAKMGFPWRGKTATITKWSYMVLEGHIPTFGQGE